MGPRNPAIEQQNMSSLSPPVTDSGSIPQIKFSFAMAHNRIEDGGWAREVTVRELPISKTLAGVNMRLGPGVVRELHWHKEAEWGYVLQGKARVTIIDPDGRTFVDDVSEGDVWLFPAGFPHSIQGVGEEGTEFILVFNDGNFSENETLLLTEWFAHTPTDVLCKNFGIAPQVLKNIPPHEKYIFRASVPPSLEEVLSHLPGEQVPSPYTFHASQVVHTAYDGGTTLVIDDRNFPVTDMAAAINTLEPGAIREMHWHPHADEWFYVVSGHLRVTVFNSVKNARTWDFFPGDVGFIPKPWAITSKTWATPRPASSMSSTIPGLPTFRSTSGWR